MAVSTATSSGSLAVSAGAKILPTAVGTSGASQGRIWSVSLTPAAAAAIITVYDNNAGDTTGTVLEKITAQANGPTISVDYAIGTAFNAGLSYVLSGSGATAIVRYELGG